MTDIGGVTACAKRGGPSLNETVRADAQTFNCPAGYSPCSDKVSPSETVCWPDGESKENCPILDIIIISVDFEESWIRRGYKMTQNTFPNRGPGTSQTKLAFSKLYGRKQVNGQQEPIISTTINTYVPCFGYDNERLILSGDQIAKTFLPFEKEDPIQVCPEI